MDFTISDDQQMLIDAVERYLERQYKFGERVAHRVRSDAHWSDFAELGLLALPFPEAYGGGGGGHIELALVMQAFGKANVTEPYVGAIAVAGALVKVAASAAQMDMLIPGMADGSRIIVAAIEEPQARAELWRIQTTYSVTDDGFVISGAKSGVLSGRADCLLVLARLAGGSVHCDNFRLFVVPTAAEGVYHISYPAVDGSEVSEYRFDRVQVGQGAQLGNGTKVLADVEFALDVGRIAVCAEAVGIMEAVVLATTEYTKQRRQFGASLASFQALQHKMVDMLVHTEQAKSSLYRALAHIDDASQRGGACAAAKAMIGTSARFVGQQAVQIHGGMGMSEEMRVSHYFRRLTAIDQTFGNASEHLRRLAMSISAQARS
ncbi:acyl-CoA dehydrogenase family protein [Cupriavidus sp. TMH.W2]|uniref:acyl-CoA dehydrogenase family protein n=1 Tax=Cupriavidus sp. TMH.W2 TaxID=3434465 RepID=UPI003D787BB4